MFDEALCLVCGNTVASGAVYCSRQCSLADSSSSSYSAPSSGHPSPQFYPADRPMAPDMPGLIYSHRNRPSLSSTSTVDSDEYVYGDKSNIFKRRPGTTNSRGVIPTLSNRPSSNRRLSSNTTDLAYMHFREDELPSSYAKTKAWKDTFALTSPSPIPPPAFLDSTSSDDEYPPADAIIDSHQETVKKRSSLKHIHRVSLPAYFSRLSIDSSTRSTDSQTPIDQAHSLPSSKSSKSSPRSRSAFGASISTSTSTVTGAFRGFTPTSIHPPSSFTHVDAIHTSTTPRGRGRERARVRQGASRSPPGHRQYSPSISSLDISPSSSPQPTIPLLVQKNELAHKIAERGRDTSTRALAANIPLCGSLGGRILREAQVKAVYEEHEKVDRGRRTRAEAGEGGEERERGRSRLVVRRSQNPPLTLSS